MRNVSLLFAFGLACLSVMPDVLPRGATGERYIDVFVESDYYGTEDQAWKRFADEYSWAMRYDIGNHDEVGPGDPVKPDHPIQWETERPHDIFWTITPTTERGGLRGSQWKVAGLLTVYVVKYPEPPTITTCQDNNLDKNNHAGHWDICEWLGHGNSVESELAAKTNALIELDWIEDAFDPEIPSSVRDAGAWDGSAVTDPVTGVVHYIWYRTDSWSTDLHDDLDWHCSDHYDD